ncbi:MAG: hypothetical protein MI861_01510 [Pirellulales bacterium]|nr:hypothetical protein [Pirellulales bacterium]
MSPIDECGVLIPAATLEDFPSDLSDSDARSLFAAWTVLWHPRLLVACQQLPTWYRADSPPDSGGSRILTVPHPSLSQLPEGFEAKYLSDEGCRWVIGSDREEMLAKLQLDAPPPVAAKHRCLAVEDFFAAGFAALQIQVMTRRLRYTSNLDEIHLQNRIVAAATAFEQGHGEAAVEAMHDVFDCLAEERDHYFASDPHLIDLTLMTGATIDSFLDGPFIGDASAVAETPNSVEWKAAAAATGEEGSEAGPQQEAENGQASQGRPASGVIATPQNVLLDDEVAQTLDKVEAARLAPLRNALATGAWGWAGGGPAPEVCLDALTFDQAEASLRQAFRTAEQVLGAAPKVFSRFSGNTPTDLTGTIVKLGYAGMIPLDFAGGTGFGDEAKVILRADGVEIESLTAKPIDAASDASFLALGARLGEAIDSGEIATALLAHWPGKGCDSYRDLRRAASWSLALGRFWKLEDYFRDGEHPYHHGDGQAASQDAANQLTRDVTAGVQQPIASRAQVFRQAVVRQRDETFAGLASLVSGKPAGAADEAPAEALLQSLGCQQAAGEASEGTLLVNPHSVGLREVAEVQGIVSKSGDHVFGVHHQGGSSTVTVDVPACGFALVQAGSTSPRAGFSMGKLLGIGRPKSLAEQNHLQNEFMDVMLSEVSGGISGVFSGSARGNRFSMRLVRGGGKRRGNAEPGNAEPGRAEPADAELGEMKCEALRVVRSTPAEGVIEASGKLLAQGGKEIASYRMTYSLKRGSRVLAVSGEISPHVVLGDQPWQDYLAARVAVANESAIARLLIRDKLHRGRSRRLVCPLGVVLDEAERLTLVAAGGAPYFARVGDRFLDVLLAVKGEASAQFHLNFGFDVNYPVAHSKALIAPPIQIPVAAAPGAAALGWLVHTAPKDLNLTGLEVARRDDGQLAAVIRVVQTRSKSCHATLRFLREIKHAMLIESFEENAVNLPLDEPDQRGTLKIKGDRVSLPLVGHQVADVLVVFSEDSKP